MHRILLSTVVVAALMGCGGGSEECVANEQVSCACPGGAQGVQVCSADGNAFSACRCEVAALSCTGVSAAGACVHGRCELKAGVAACACEPWYTGARCDQCAEGFQDRDQDGTCQPACSASTCGPHKTCSDDTGIAVCTCAPGYATAADNRCDFAGLVKDPTFIEGSAAWSAAGGGLVDPVGLGNGGAGLAKLPGRAQCSASVSQTLKMPALATSEPMRLSFATQVYCDGSCSWDTRPVLHLGGFPTRIPASTRFMWFPRSLCLGERAYGGAKELRLGMEDELGCSTYSYGIAFDDVRIAPDATCPAPGQVLDGDFERTGTWVMRGTSVVPNEGAQGTSALRLSLPDLCATASATGTVSLPLAGGNALEFKFSGTPAALLDVVLDDWELGSVHGAGNPFFTTARSCIPEALKGTAPTLTFRMRGETWYCTTPPALAYLVDDVRVVEDPSCGATAPVVNGGFERTDPALGWALEVSHANADLLSSVQVTTSDRRSGSRSLHLVHGNPCGGTQASTVITVPPAQGAAGPAVRYWYRSAGTDDAANSFKTSVRGTQLPFTPQWTQRTECLDPARTNQPFELEFKSQGGGLCATRLDEQLFVDDVAVTTDASCPAQ